MGTTTIHGFGRIQIHLSLVLGVGTSHHGKVSGGCFWGWLGILFLYWSTQVVLVISINHNHINSAKKYYFSHTARIPIPLSLTVRHGRNTGLSGMVDGQIGIWQWSARWSEWNLCQSVQAGGKSWYSRWHIFSITLDRFGRVVVSCGFLHCCQSFSNGSRWRSSLQNRYNFSSWKVLTLAVATIYKESNVIGTSTR